MSASDTKGTSGTDWTRVDALTDDEIDTSDIPPLNDDFFARATLRMPTERVSVTVHVDADVLACFRSQGESFEERMRAALRLYAEAHKR